MIKSSIVVKYVGNKPLKATKGSSGYDLTITQDFILEPMERALVPTGLRCEIPEGYEAQIRPRSGLALKKGISVLNTPGTIDSDYRGEFGVILINLSSKPVHIKKGERIAQLVFQKVENVEFKEVQELNDTARGSGGFGSTGN